MKKIVAVCGNGLGSSFMVEINIKNVLSSAGITDYEVSHSDLTSFSGSGVDILVIGKDLVNSVQDFKGTTVVLENLVSKEELEGKLLKVIK